MDFFSLFAKDKLLKDYSTFGIGGPARFFLEITDIKAMQDCIAFCAQEKIPYIVIGKGSNCLFDDKGFDGLVILNKIGFCEFEADIVSVGAGYSFSLLGSQTARKGFSGLEFASGIPATVGGAIFMNAGANGSEVSNCLIDVSYVNEKGELEILTKESLIFSYRHSSFQEKKGAIVGARFKLTLSPEARAKQLGIIEYRTKTQPYGDKSAGCLFRNPQSFSAGALIQECGLKGVRIGGAEVSTLHANFIINREGATAEDILKLADLVQKTVREKKGVDLHMEVRQIAFSTKEG